MLGSNKKFVRKCLEIHSVRKTKTLQGSKSPRTGLFGGFSKLSFIFKMKDIFVKLDELDEMDRMAQTIAENIVVKWFG